MYSLVKIELIKQFLANYSIDYEMLTLDTQTIVILLSNIFFLLTIFIGLYIIYRVLAKIL